MLGDLTPYENKMKETEYPGHEPWAFCYWRYMNLWVSPFLNMIDSTCPSVSVTESRMVCKRVRAGNKD